MDGVLLLHKPRGMTSNDCVQKVRKLFRTKKAGHTGTLDPDVSGVLPICIGKATKISSYLMAENKEYIAEVTLGAATETEDASGSIIAEKEVKLPPSKEEIERVLESFRGEIEQIPPMYSAVKVNGKKLYEYAREGKVVERPKRRVVIHAMHLLSDIKQHDKTASFSIQVSCSKGTYIRTLAVMIGEKLGYPAHMSELVRIRSGRFHLHDCVTFSAVEQCLKTGDLPNGFLTIEEALNQLPKIKINDTLAKKVKNGAMLEMNEDFQHIGQNDVVAIWNNREIIAIYKKHSEKNNVLKPVKVLKTNE